MIAANDPKLTSWVEVPEGSDFPIQNIPFGIIEPEGMEPRPASRIGDYCLDLSVLADFGFFDELDIEDLSCFYSPVLNDLIALGRPRWASIRNRISELLSDQNQELQSRKDACKIALKPVSEVRMKMPVQVQDYTDFYSSEEHATNVGKMFRDPENALLPNWKHIPVGYHGRSSSIVISGTPIHRPKGQLLLPGREKPVFGTTNLLDFELEMAFICGSSTQLGSSIPVSQAHEHIFGMLIFNDLSARDIQKWEYVPLGPFLSKSFGSVVSPWIVTLDALEPFRVKGPVQKPEVLDYLKLEGENHFDIKLEVYIQASPNDTKDLICQSNHKYLYWSIFQQLAHQTVNGCNVNIGDMYASGTISGPDEHAFGSMLELSWKGSKPLALSNGLSRKFIEDGDSIIMKAYAEKEGVRIGFGESQTQILPAL